MSEIPLTGLLDAVDENLPSASLIIDPSGNTVTFYKYKGTLASAEVFEIIPESIRRKFKYAASRGSTLALNVNPDTDLSEIITTGILPPEGFNTTRLTDEILKDYMDNPRDYLAVQDNYRLVFIVQQEEYPPQLQQFLDSGDLKVIRIAH